MKKNAINAIFACLFPLLASTAFAAGVSDGNTQVRISVQLIEGAKPVASYIVNTVEGTPAPIGTGNDISYIDEATKEERTVRTGFFMSLTPTFTKEGKIQVAFAAEKSEVSIQNFRQNEVEMQLPQISSIALKQNIALDDGKEVSIPFGSVKTTNPQYVLKLVASKVND